MEGAPLGKELVTLQDLVGSLSAGQARGLEAVPVLTRVLGSVGMCFVIRAALPMSSSVGAKR